MDLGVIQLPQASGVLFAIAGAITLVLIRAALVEGPPSVVAWLLPRIVHNIAFASRAQSLLNKGYKKFKTRPFQLLQADKDALVLPPSCLNELCALPVSVASPNTALESDLLGPYTGLDLILDTRLHFTVVQRKLTPRLNALAPRLEREVFVSLAADLPTSESKSGEWVEFQPYFALGKSSSRLASLVTVGAAFDRRAEWEELTWTYVENLFRTIVLLRLLPSWSRPLVARFTPSYWVCQKSLQRANEIIGPWISDLLRQHDSKPASKAGGKEDVVSDDNDHAVMWMLDMVRGEERNAATISHVLMLLSLAAVHTTLLRMVSVLYDLVADPDLLEEIREEVTSVLAKNDGSNPYDQMHKLDSVLRESQRLSPPSLTGLKRHFLRSYTFRNGITVPANSYVCLPTAAVERDPEHYPDPDTFDGLRHYRGAVAAVAEASPESNVQTDTDKGIERAKIEAAGDPYRFSATGPKSLNFGHGRHACPGRFFASLVVKMMVAHLLISFDFQFLPGSSRPRNMMVHEFLFTWPWEKMLIRPRAAHRQASL